MKYKIAKPEDYTDVEGYAFKLSHAYSKCHYDVSYLLVRIDGILDAIEMDYTDMDDVKKWLTQIQKEYES